MLSYLGLELSFFFARADEAAPHFAYDSRHRKKRGDRQPRENFTMHNPYKFKMPCSSCGFDKTTTDLPPRVAVSAAIRAFVNQQINSAELWQRLDGYVESNDAIAKLVADEVCLDFDDSAITVTELPKDKWDLLQRYLLLLESNCRVIQLKTIRRSWTQAAAAAALLGFLVVAAQFGMRLHLLIFAMPFGALSIALTFIRARLIPQETVLEQIIAPFQNLSDLERAYRNCQSFRKQRYPRWLAEHNRNSAPQDSPLSRLIQTMFLMPAFVVWSMCAPATLLFQSFPVTTEKYRALSQ